MWRRDSNAVCQFVGWDCVKLLLLRNKKELMHMKASSPNRKMCLSYKLMSHWASEPELVHYRRKNKTVTRINNGSALRTRCITQHTKFISNSDEQLKFWKSTNCSQSKYAFKLISLSAASTSSRIWYIWYIQPWDTDINCSAQTALMLLSLHRVTSRLPFDHKQCVGEGQEGQSRLSVSCVQHPRFSLISPGTKGISSADTLRQRL